MLRWSAPHCRLKKQERVSHQRLLLTKVNTQNTSFQSFITSCLLRQVLQCLGARAATQEETLPPQDRRSCQCHHCGERRRSPPKGEQSCPGSIPFLQPREERKEVHPWALLFSLFKVDSFMVVSALGFPTRRAPSADCYFPNPCTGESVFPKDGESEGQDDNVVYPVLSSWEVTASSGITLEASIPEICYSHWAFLPLWCACMVVLPKMTSKALVLSKSEHYSLHEYLSKMSDC